MQVERKPVNDGVVRLLVAGEVDMTTAGDLTAAGAAGLAEPACTRLEVDLSGVSFLDSSGIGALVAIRTEARNAGKPMQIVEAPDRVRQVIDVCGLTNEFGMSRDPVRSTTQWSTS